MTTSDRTILGIDLGVTGVTMASFEDDGRTRVIPNADGGDTTPACLHVYDEEGVVVGAEARKMAAIEPDNVVEDVPWHLGEADWHPTMHGRTWTSQELTGLLLRKLREDASELRGADVRRAVIAVPAWYDSARRHATVEAAEIGGLDVLSLVNQPLCAALGVGAQALEHDGPIVVFDLGGRDLEVTALHKEGDSLTVRASQVRYDLCVRAFELRVRSLLVERYRAKASGDAGTEDELLAQQVVDAAHNALHTLFHRQTAATRISHAGVQVKVEIDRATFGARTAPLVVSAVGLIDQVLAEAGHGIDDVIACIAVGRGARMPGVRQALVQRLGDRLILPDSPDQAIAQGAARLAVLRHDKQHPGLTATPVVPTPRVAPELVETEDDSGTSVPPAEPERRHRASFGLADGGDAAVHDATTQDLGLIALDRERRERVIRLIPKGTPVPCEVRGRFTYAYEGMRGVRVEVTEGRGSRREDVQVIGVVELRGLPARPVGTPIEIHYAYGEDQILSVQVVDVETGHARDATITFRGGLDDEAMKEAAQHADEIQLK